MGAGGARRRRCAAAARLVITAHTVLVVTHPLHGLAQRGAAATLRVVLREIPARSATSPSGGPDAARVVVLAELVGRRRARAALDGRRPGVAAGARPGWLGLLPGRRHGRGLLAPAERTDLTVAVLRVQ
jgi:competence protein ComEC